MRFKATLVDCNAINNISKLVTSLAKLAKSCIIKLTTNKIFLILAESQLKGGASVWCELPQANFCSGYEFGGHGVTNEIFLEINLDQFSYSLRSALPAKMLRIKLTQKKTPCLTFEVTLPSLSSSNRVMTHDVAVRTIPSRLWSDYSEPVIPRYDVSIYLPPHKVLKTVLDRLRNLSGSLLISANNNGELIFKVKSDVVTTSVNFKDLTLAKWTDLDSSQASQSTDGPAAGGDKNHFYDVNVDIKKIQQFLSCMQIALGTIVCNVMENESVMLFILQDDISIQYTLPGHNVM